VRGEDTGTAGNVRTLAGVPWCDDCSRYWNPPTLVDGACPTCGRQLETMAEERAPWHFKLLVVLVAVYLAFRAYQGLAWLVHRG
jgi:hypothetical protein